MWRQEKYRILLVLISLLTVVLLVCNNGYAAEKDVDYDPQHTMLALNTAIVSIHRIITTEDRIILDQEYRNIINNLKIGNIEDDYELKSLFQELMDVISRKTLRKEELERFQRKYDSREKNLLVNSLTNIRAYGGNAWSFLGSLVTSGISAYFGYQNSKNELLEGLDDEFWALHKDDVEDINDLQKRLLDSSWSLLRQYKLPDEYRLTQANMTDFDKAVQETDSEKSVRMFRALEPHFKVYPPFWYFYGKAAFQNGDIELARKCFTEFENVWRPVLRQDPYRLEVAKYRVMDLSDNKAPNDEIIAQLNIIRENTPRNDWNNNLFAGVMYFAVGDKEQGMDCLQINIDFESERDISDLVLQSMKQGKLNIAQLSKELQTVLQALNARDEEEKLKAEKAKAEEIKALQNNPQINADIVKDEERAAFNFLKITYNLRSLKAATLMFYADSMDEIHASPDFSKILNNNPNFIQEHLIQYGVDPSEFNAEYYIKIGEEWFVGYDLTRSPVELKEVLQRNARWVGLFGTAAIEITPTDITEDGYYNVTHNAVWMRIR
jgi:hypothetical protein